MTETRARAVIATNQDRIVAATGCVNILEPGGFQHFM